MKQRKHVKLSTSGRQKQRMKMRYIAATAVLTLVTIIGIAYLNFSNPESSAAATTKDINDINYRSTTTEIDNRYLRTAEQTKEDHRHCLREGKSAGKISIPSRGQDIAVRTIQPEAAN